MKRIPAISSFLVLNVYNGRDEHVTHQRKVPIRHEPRRPLRRTRVDGTKASKKLTLPAEVIDLHAHYFKANANDSAAVSNTDETWLTGLC